MSSFPAVAGFYCDFDTAALDENRARRGPDEHRGAFQIDRDRILHSAAFRRLQGKTQVFHSFLVGEYDFYRSRLTHSLEVAQVGRAICGWLKNRGPAPRDGAEIDPDLVEAACLAHDLGHPPFGHTGERALHRLMEEFGGFEGNAQTLRLLTETLFGDGREGMNPTRALMDAVLKYKTLHREAAGAESHYLYDEQETCLDFVLDGAPFPAELPPGAARNQFRSLECQVMDWADDTAYSINDLSDGILAGFVTVSGIEAWAQRQSLTSDEAAHLDFLLDAIRSGRFEGRLGRSIGEHIRACSLRPRQNFLAGRTRRYEFELAIDEAVLRKAALNKRLAFDLVFRTPRLQQLDFKAELMLERLFEALREQYVERERPRLHLLPASVEQSIAAAPGARARARLVCDWLANLTDRAAFHAHQRMFDASAGPGMGLV